jgi:three-Cys-motif partner protein
MSIGRGWGPWSEIKLDILSEYLDRFTTASKRSDEIVYLDLFAGEPRNHLRTTGAPIVGSAHRALAVDNPPFSRCLFFELPQNAAKLRSDLEQTFPPERFHIYDGDCNGKVHQALADLKAENVAWAPTFAFVDPDGPDCHWTTLEALARHKGPGTDVHVKSKVEFWFLFATMFNRQLPLDVGKAVRPEDAEQVTRMYGTEQWRAIYELRKADEMSGTEAREEYINLMRWRIENVLGYEWTHPLDVPNEQGVPIYTMILATDHPAGTSIMSAIYNGHAGRFPAMRIQAQRRKWRQAKEAVGQFDLFSALDDDGEPMVNEEIDPSLLPVDRYEYFSPWTPPGTVNA